MRWPFSLISSPSNSRYSLSTDIWVLREVIIAGWRMRRYVALGGEGWDVREENRRQGCGAGAVGGLLRTWFLGWGIYLTRGNLNWKSTSGNGCTDDEKSVTAARRSGQR